MKLSGVNGRDTELPPHLSQGPASQQGRGRHGHCVGAQDRVRASVHKSHPLRMCTVFLMVLDSGGTKACAVTSRFFSLRPWDVNGA